MSGMDTESRFVPRDQDTGEDRTFFKWCHSCCGEDECSKKFHDRVKNFTSYKSRDVVRKHMINHLFNGWTHKQHRTWQLAAERVAEYLELHPDAIEEKTETYEERENYRVEMEDYYQTKVEQDNEDQDNYEPIDGPHQPAYPPDESLLGEPADDVGEETQSCLPCASSSKNLPRNGKGTGSKGKPGTGKGKKRAFDNDFAKSEISKKARSLELHKNAMMSGLQMLANNAEKRYEGAIEVRGEFVTLPVKLMQTMCDSAVRVRNSAQQLNMIAIGLVNTSEHEVKVLELSTSHMIEAMMRSEEYKPFEHW